MICAVIFARGGSKGVPRKNIRLIGGKPLIAYAIETAIESDLIQRVFVSTDDREIADIATQYGAEVPFLRPKELAGDQSPEWLAWRHAIQYLRNDLKIDLDVFVSLPPTAPLRTVDDVNNCILAYLNGDADIVITASKAKRHPSFNMINLDGHGRATLVMPPPAALANRQSTPAVFDMTTVAYVADPDYVLRFDSIFSRKVSAVIVPSERAIDIDTLLDLEFAQFLIEKNK